MPTGYTSYILENGYDFKQFAMLCTRAVGALIDMKEDSMETPIPQKLKVSSYHKSALNDARKELIIFQKKSDKEFLSELIQDREARLSSLERAVLKTIRNGVRCSKILEDAKRWTPPTKDHEQFKKFMIEQLEGTLDMDCDIAFYTREIDATQSELKKLKRASKKTISRFRVQEMHRILKDIQYHEKHYNEDVKGTETKQKWLDEIRESLK